MIRAISLHLDFWEENWRVARSGHGYKNVTFEWLDKISVALTDVAPLVRAPQTYPICISNNL
jgi:hypothetical protein